MLFISTLRGKLGVIALASCIILTAKGLNTGLSLGEVFSQVGFVMFLFLLFGIALLIPDLVYLINGPVKAWSSWGILRRTYCREDFEEYDFLMFHPRTKFALGSDENGCRVAATLLRCSCRDFQKNKRPCIHMHKLAELLELDGK